MWVLIEELGELGGYLVALLSWLPTVIRHFLAIEVQNLLEGKRHRVGNQAAAAKEIVSLRVNQGDVGRDFAVGPLCQDNVDGGLGIDNLTGDLRRNGL